MSQDLDKPTALPVAEALVALAAVRSPSELETRLESGRAVIDERSRKRRNAAKRKEISRQAKALAPVLIYAHGASTAVEGMQSEILSRGVPDFLLGVIEDVFPNTPQDGPAAGFPVRQLRSRIRELFQAGKLDEHQMKVLLCAVRKANNELAGESPKAQKTGHEDKVGSDHKKESETGHLFRGPRQIPDAVLSRLPGAIRSAANRLKEKPARQIPASYPVNDSLLADCSAYFDALESRCKDLGGSLAYYAEVLKTHEHDRRNEDRLLEWLVQAPVEPPETVRALLADLLDWVQIGGKDG